MKPRTVKVHIKELVLEGVSLSDRYRVVEELQSELSRLFAKKGVPALLREAGNLESIHAKPPRPSDGKPKGSRIARAIYGGLER